MSTLRQIVERLETLRDKRDMIEAMKDWLNKNFTGSTGINGRVISAEVIDELLVDIDSALLAPTNDDINFMESMEVTNGKGSKRPTSDPKQTKKGRKGN